MKNKIKEKTTEEIRSDIKTIEQKQNLTNKDICNLFNSMLTKIESLELQTKQIKYNEEYDRELREII